MRLISRLLLALFVGVFLVGFLFLLLPKSPTSKTHPLSAEAKMLLVGHWKVAGEPIRFRDGRVFVTYQPLLLPGTTKNATDRHEVGYTYDPLHYDYMWASELHAGQVVHFLETDVYTEYPKDGDTMKYLKVRVVK